MRPLILIGYRGTGKTSLGKRLARRLSRGFTDTDQLVVTAAGRSIPEIFAEEGEAAFRRREAAALAEACRAGGRVIATGGGIVLLEENMSLLRKCGAVVWLTARPEVILSRIAGDANRPALTGLGPLEEIRSMLEIRNPLYAEVAALTVDTSDRPFLKVAEEIREWFLGEMGG